MKKAFIGPIGDDLPSIVALLLALTLFFSGMVYSLNLYNQKIANTNLVKASVEIAREILDQGLIETLDVPDAEYVAYSYALNYEAYLDDGSNPPACGRDSYRFSYLVAKHGSGDRTLYKLTICTSRK